MPTPREILDDAFRRALESLENPLIEDTESIEGIELISRFERNRAFVRFVLSCALAKAHRPELDIRKPYTKIGGNDSFSGRNYDENPIADFFRDHRLPVNDTTAYLTPAFRTNSTALTPDMNLGGRPAALYTVTLKLLAAVHDGKVTPEGLIAEILRLLVIVQNEKDTRLKLLMEGVQATANGAIPLSSEEIVTLIEQHLRSPNSSRLPVLVVAAAYEAGGAFFGEHARPLESHNAADSQTRAIGDVEVTLIGDDDVVTGYEMKTRRVTRGDIDIALQKVLQRGGIQNYVFITTETIDREVKEYAASLYERTGGIELVVLDCVTFLRHFLHLFHRHRAEFVEAYQRLVLAQPDSSVGSPLKELWLALRRAAETRIENLTEEAPSA